MYSDLFCEPAGRPGLRGVGLQFKAFGANTSAAENILIYWVLLPLSHPLAVKTNDFCDAQLPSAAEQSEGRPAWVVPRREPKLCPFKSSVNIWRPPQLE